MTLFDSSHIKITHTQSTFFPLFHPFYNNKFRMAQNLLKTSARACTARRTNCIQQSAKYSNGASSWFRRFLSPKEEKELYLGITSSFRDKLVEQSNKSTQSYSHIIEHALLTSKATSNGASALSMARLDQLKLDLDAAGKNKEIHKIQALEMEMDHAGLTVVAMYNRLIRAYLWSDSLTLAEQVLAGFEQRGLVPTSRTYTYLIQAHLKKDQLENAKSLVKRMQHLSLHNRLRNDFDCSIMLKYYKACGNSYAIDYLWRDMLLHVDSVKPGIVSFTTYLEHLLERDDIKSVAQLAHDYLLHQTGQQHLQLHPYVTWMKAVNLLVTTDNYTQHAEQLLLVLIKRAPAKTSWDIAKHAISKITASYLNEEQDLKTLAFYYRLKKMGVPNQAFEPDMMASIEHVLKKVEKKADDKAIAAELGGLVLAHT